MALDDLAHVEAASIIRALHEAPHDPIAHMAAVQWLREHHPEPASYLAALRAIAGVADAEGFGHEVVE